MMSVCRYCIDNCRYLDIYTCRCVVVTAKAADLVSVAAAAVSEVSAQHCRTESISDRLTVSYAYVWL